MNGEVLIVDEHTGRILAGRRYNEGMHQAIEAKEGVEIKDENQTLATITLQNYFRLYDKLAGMTGTAMTEAAEFHQIYKLGVVPIPTNRPMVRDRPARPGLPHRGGQVRARSSRTSSSGTRRASRSWSAPSSVEKSEYLSAAAAQARRPARGAQRQAPRAGGADRRPGRAQGRRHRRHQHGRPWHRHHARRQPRGPRRRPSCAQRGLDPVEHAGGVRGRAGPRRWRRPRRRSQAEHDEVVDARRALRAGHRAARVAPHRQPAARPLRPPGRPGRVPVLPVAAATT